MNQTSNRLSGKSPLVPARARTLVPLCLAFTFVTAGCATAPMHRSAEAISYIDDKALLNKLRRAANAPPGTYCGITDVLPLAPLRAPEGSVPVAPPRRKRLRPDQLYLQCRSSVVIIASLGLCKDCNKRHALSTSAGFVVTPSGVCVTNYHVAEHEPDATLVAMTRDGTIYPVTAVIAADKQCDVAALQAEGLRAPPLPIAADTPVGAPVVIISHPNRKFYTLTQGIVSRYFVRYDAQQTVAQMAVTAEYAKGSSGAPVLNAAGAVAGMVATTSTMDITDENGKVRYQQMVLRTCIPSEAILDVLGACPANRHDVTDTAPVGQEEH